MVLYRLRERDDKGHVFLVHDSQYGLHILTSTAFQGSDARETVPRDSLYSQKTASWLLYPLRHGQANVRRPFLSLVDSIFPYCTKVNSYILESLSRFIVIHLSENPRHQPGVLYHNIGRGGISTFPFRRPFRPCRPFLGLALRRPSSRGGL